MYSPTAFVTINANKGLLIGTIIPLGSLLKMGGSVELVLVFKPYEELEGLWLDLHTWGWGGLNPFLIQFIHSGVE